jgi:uncharacterized protein (DUF433 family)
MTTLRDRITVDPAICHGKPTVRGLRYPVELILDLLSSGMSDEEILADYPDLEHDDILAVRAYAADVTNVPAPRRSASREDGPPGGRN